MTGNAPESSAPSFRAFRLRKIGKSLAFSLVPLIILLLALELAVRLLLPASLTNQFFSETAKEMVRVQLPDGGPPQNFANPKPPGTFRIFVLGESSAAGYPYAPVSTFPKRLQALARTLANNPNLEVINLAVNAYNSDDILFLLRQAIPFQPDLIVVYAGHNEMVLLPRFNQIAYPRLYPAYAFLREHSRIAGYYLYQQRIKAAAATFRDFESKVTPSSAASPQFSAELRHQAAQNFAANLDAISTLCRARGARLVLMTVVSNDADSYPLRSAFGSLRGKAEQDQYRAELREIETLLGQRNWTEALARLGPLRQREPDYALAYFLQGRALLAVNRLPEAREAFIQARDLDDFPKRAPTVINETIRAAARRQQVFLLDLPEILRAESPEKLFGFDYFYDSLHPNLFLQQRMAETLLKFLDRERLLPSPLDPQTPWPSFMEINRQLQVTPEFMANRDLSQAFALGFSAEAPPLYLDYARKLLADVQAKFPADFLAPLALAVLRLRNHDPEGFRVGIESLLKLNPVRSLFLLEHYFSPQVQVADNLILAKTEFDGNLSYILRKKELEGISPPSERGDPLVLPEDPAFLAQFDYAWTWDDDSQQFRDVKKDLTILLEKRAHLLADQAPRTAAPVVLRDFRALNCRPGNQPNFLAAVSADPQLLSARIRVEPMLTKALSLDLAYSRPTGNAPPPEQRIEIFWTTKSEPNFTGRHRMIFLLPAAPGPQPISISLTNRWRWLQSDTVTSIRIDPSRETGTEFRLNQITFIPEK